MGLADRDYMHDRRSSSVRCVTPLSSSSSWPRAGFAIFISAAVSLVTIAGSLINQYGIPSFVAPAGPIQRFPSSGDVFVSPDADLRRGQSKFRVAVPPGDHNNYVVLLSDATSGRRMMAIYCRSSDDVIVPVPVGRYRVRVASGQDWFGMHDLFGRTTHVEDVLPDMVAEAGKGTGIVFQRRPDGNLPTRTMPKSRFSGDL